MVKSKVRNMHICPRTVIVIMECRHVIMECRLAIIIMTDLFSEFGPVTYCTVNPEIS